MNTITPDHRVFILTKAQKEHLEFHIHSQESCEREFKLLGAEMGFKPLSVIPINRQSYHSFFALPTQEPSS